MLDMIKPTIPGCVTLSDLKRCRMTSIFFDTFFNLEKYMEHEQRDPFAQRDSDDVSSVVVTGFWILIYSEFFLIAF
jgi:serine/threonine-protein phosphatase 2A regulatory subunit B''